VNLGQALVGNSSGHALHHSSNLGQNGLLDDGGGRSTVDQRSTSQVTGLGGSHGKKSSKNELKKGRMTVSNPILSIQSHQDPYQFEHFDGELVEDSSTGVAAKGDRLRMC